MRFVTSTIHQVTGVRVGFFQAAYGMVKSDTRTDWEKEWIESILEWFEIHLPVSGPQAFADGKAIHWFRSEAGEHVAQAWRMAWALRTGGIPVSMLRTRKPGYVRYRDRFQVAAEPFGDTFLTGCAVDLSEMS